MSDEDTHTWYCFDWDKHGVLYWYALRGGRRSKNCASLAEVLTAHLDKIAEPVLSSPPLIEGEEHGKA